MAQITRENHRLSPEQRKGVGDIERCRTAHLEDTWTLAATAAAPWPSPTTPAAIGTVPSARACEQAKWLEARLERLLPTRYFHLVVTLPHELNPVTLLNRELVFNLLFEAASRGLLQFARDYERLRAQIGFTAVLHTWDQELNSHNHLHLVVTGGGLKAIIFPSKVIIVAGGKLCCTQPAPVSSRSRRWHMLVASDFLLAPLTGVPGLGSMGSPAV